MATKATRAVGVDIGGTGIKAGIVDLEPGELAQRPRQGRDARGRRARRRAGRGAAGARHARRRRRRDLPLGVAFPAIVKSGRTLSAANVSKKWIGFEAEKFFEDGSARGIHFANDADVAGVAEVRYGAAKGTTGSSILTTLGTGIGSAHDLRRRARAQQRARSPAARRAQEGCRDYAAYSAMEREELSWEKWAKRLQWYYSYVEFLFSPDLFVVGGGVSKHAEKFLPLLNLHDADRAGGAPQQRGDHRGGRTDQPSSRSAAPRIAPRAVGRPVR